jgi:hypothetical protein
MPVAPRRRPWAWTRAAAWVAVAGLASASGAPRRLHAHAPAAPEPVAPAALQQEPPIHNAPYDGRFTFARLTYETGPGGYYYGGLPAWAHGYPRAERNLMRILREVSNVDGHVDESEALALDDPELFKYPLAYMTEAGYWTLTDRQAAALRAYLLKGGFVVFDDFRGDFGWEHFAANMQRVLPGTHFIDLDPSMPVYQSFFGIASFDIVRQYYDRGTPVFRGLFEDDDPHKRLMAVANFNTDVANFWEFSADGATPVDASNEAYKLGVNYVMYGLTH